MAGFIWDNMPLVEKAIDAIDFTRIRAGVKINKFPGFLDLNRYDFIILNICRNPCCRKDTLWQNFRQMQKKFGKAFDFHPDTFQVHKIHRWTYLGTEFLLEVLYTPMHYYPLFIHTFCFDAVAVTSLIQQVMFSAVAFIKFYAPVSQPSLWITLTLSMQLSATQGNSRNARNSCNKTRTNITHITWRSVPTSVDIIVFKVSTSFGVFLKTFKVLWNLFGSLRVFQSIRQVKCFELLSGCHESFYQLSKTLSASNHWQEVLNIVEPSLGRSRSKMFSPIKSRFSCRLNMTN